MFYLRLNERLLTIDIVLQFISMHLKCFDKHYKVLHGEMLWQALQSVVIDKDSQCICKEKITTLTGGIRWVSNKIYFIGTTGAATTVFIITVTATSIYFILYKNIKIVLVEINTIGCLL